MLNANTNKGKMFFWNMSAKIDELSVRVSNVFKWLPTIWNDRQENYLSLLMLIEKKLELMHQEYNSDKLCLDYSDVEKQDIEVSEALVILSEIKCNPSKENCNKLFKLLNKNIQNWNI